MDYGFLLAIPLGLAAGVGGGLFTTWTWARRLLALEQYVATLQLAYDDHLKKLDTIVTRQDKTEASKVRWSKKSADEEALAKQLTIQSPIVPYPDHWNPKTFNGA